MMLYFSNRPYKRSVRIVGRPIDGLLMLETLAIDLS